jgi:hypothetical protein
MTDSELLSFVATSIRSVWALELLLFLKRNAARTWNADSLILELRSSHVVIAETLRALQACGLVVQEGGSHYRYGAASSILDQITTELEQLYAAKPQTVINAIVNLSNQQLRAFSDAFKLKD